MALISSGKSLISQLIKFSYLSILISNGSDDQNFQDIVQEKAIDIEITTELVVGKIMTLFAEKVVLMEAEISKFVKYHMVAKMIAQDQ
jgi:hypothetical protein